MRYSIGTDDSHTAEHLITLVQFIERDNAGRPLGHFGSAAVVTETFEYLLILLSDDYRKRIYNAELSRVLVEQLRSIADEIEQCLNADDKGE